MSNDPAFALVATLPQTQMSLYEASRDPEAPWSGYFLPSSGLPSPGTTPPDRIGFKESLDVYGGSYLYASTRPAGLETVPGNFMDALLAYLASQGVLPARVILWVKTADPVSFGPFATYGLTFGYEPIGQIYRTNSNINAVLGQNLSFFILQGTQVTIDLVTGGLRLSAAVSPSPFIGFQKGNTDLGITVTGTSGFIRTFVPFVGVNTGCCLFTAQVRTDKLFGASGLTAGFQYTVNDADSKQVETFFYPAFAAGALPRQLSCVGSVDILDPYNQRLAESARLAGVLRTGLAPLLTPAFPSGFRTPTGKQITLYPLGAEGGQPPVVGLQSGALALTTAATAPSTPGTSLASFTFAGRFGLAVDGLVAGKPGELLCGIFGSERITFTTFDPVALTNDLLLFVMGGAAYAPVFPFATATLDDPTSGDVVPLLKKDGQGAWGTVLAGGTPAPAYRAEPAGSPLFGYPPTSAPSGEGAPSTALIPPLLQSAPPSLPLPQGAAHAFPLVPYAVGPTMAGLATPIPADTLAGFESSILAATRKRLVSAGATGAWEARAATQLQMHQAALRLAAGLPVTAADPPAPAISYRTTPQGAVATVEPDSGAFQAVILGQSMAPSGKVYPFAFNLPSQPLQDALETNQLFLVAVNPQYLNTLPGTFDNVVEIAGWTMQAQVGSGATATAYRNVMLLKYCSGSLKDRIQNPNAWSAAPQFSLLAGLDAETSTVAYTGLSQWLQNVVAAAEARVAANSDSPYRNFVRLVQDPSWNGVLVLAASLDPASLPAGLQGIAAGLDLGLFTAHHFGFTISRVTLHRDQTITLAGNSSTFGLVDYLDPSYGANLASGQSPDAPIPLATKDNYAFRVLQLQALFDNAALKTFKSNIQLTVDKLLGSPVLVTTLAGARLPANGVVLNGSYVDQNGVGVYVFEQNTPTIFTLDSNLLLATAFTRIQFNSLGTIDAGSTVLNRFLVWGKFAFAALKDLQGEPLDVLSFGGAAAVGDGALTGGTGLAFFNLQIDMTYPVTTPAAVTFAENTSKLAYDLEASQVRKGSLFQGFGLQLSSFIAATAGQRPADYGFLPVTVGVDLTLLEGPWYGVVYDVTMGGPGALASAVGFNSSLLLAWAPTTGKEERSQALFVGLSLPGAAPGAKLFSIQGVFKLSVGNVSLVRQEVPGRSPPSWYYCLRLDNIGIKVLGIAKLPPDATIQFFLFGDPDNTGSLGWYAAYIADPSAMAGGEGRAALGPLEEGRSGPDGVLVTAGQAPVLARIN